MIEALGMMSCEDALARLWEFLDGELPADEMSRVRRHLEVCRRCYPHYDFQLAYRRRLKALAEQERAPESCRARVVAALLAEEEER